MKNKHLYIHIPFCKYICSYCDFCKKYAKNYNLDTYLDYLDQELSMYDDYQNIETIFIGGGTPSVLDIKQITKLKNILTKYINLNQIKEFSFEMNPDDINQEYLLALKDLGVNRLSIGIQTLNNHILSMLGRKYSKKDVETNIKIATSIFDNVSCDFMFNLPTQILNDLDQVFSFIKDNPEIKHISFYDLIIEEHTILGNQDYHYLSEEEESDWYKYLQEQLHNLGFSQYEISNWAKDNSYQSQHNLGYWRIEDYIGIGLSSSSCYQGYRYTNTYSIKEYYQALDNKQLPIKDYEEFGKYEKAYDTIMLGLRTSEGIDEKVVENFPLKKEFFATINKRVRIKNEYYFVSNSLILELLMQLEEKWQILES